MKYGENKERIGREEGEGGVRNKEKKAEGKG